MQCSGIAGLTDFLDKAVRDAERQIRVLEHDGDSPELRLWRAREAAFRQVQRQLRRMQVEVTETPGREDDQLGH